mgnify:CR=1 FL=1
MYFGDGKPTKCARSKAMALLICDMGDSGLESRVYDLALFRFGNCCRLGKVTEYGFLSAKKVLLPLVLIMMLLLYKVSESDVISNSSALALTDCEECIESKSFCCIPMCICGNATARLSFCNRLSVFVDAGF